MRRFLFSLITELVAFARNRLFILFILSGIPAVSPAVEFNTDALDADDRQNVDLSQFEKKDYISPGRYLVQITLNKNTLPGDWNVEWRATSTENGTQLCLTSDQLLQWGFNDAFVHQLNNRGQTQCLDIIDKPEFSAKLDKSTMRLTLTVPQSWMKYHAKNWTPPEYWDEGVNGALLDYNIYASQYSPHDGDNTQSFSAYGTAGVNVGAWRLRSDYQYNQNFISGNSTDTESRLARTYLFRPLPSLASKFTLGQYDLSSDIFDTFHFTGTTLESDESMLPPDLQGYAPQITGIAQTNAKVTVSQNGRVLYQTTVTPGPFTISDMVDTLQGQMDVTIEEEDGRTSTFQVGSASVPFLTRQGQLRYKTSAGKPTSNSHNDVHNPLFWTGEFSWGWLSTTSLYGGAILTADDYQAFTSGIGFNLNVLGAVSFDVTRSQANLTQETGNNNQHGYSYRMNYARRFDATDSQITFAGYRFSDKNYVSMNEYLDYREGDDGSDNEKESYVLSFSQSIAPWNMSAWLNISRNTYWNAASNTSYSLSLNHSFAIGELKGLSASLAVTRTRWDDTDENQYYFSLSVPLSAGRNLAYNQQRYGDNTTQSLSYFDSSDRDNTWNLSVSADNDQLSDGEPALRGSYQHYATPGRLSLAASVQPNHYSSMNLGWNSAITATRYGVAMHDRPSGNNARMMVDANGVSGVELSRGRSVTNAFGIAVIPSLSNYQTATVQVNSNTLPEGVDISSPVFRTTLTEGAIGYKALNASQGYQIMGVVRLENGTFPPLGVSVIDSKTRKDVGLIADDGFVYLSGLQENSVLSVSWGEHTCEIIPPNHSNLDSALILPCRYTHQARENHETD